jgi:hypothetical protein
LVAVGSGEPQACVGAVGAVVGGDGPAAFVGLSVVVVAEQDAVHC